MIQKLSESDEDFFEEDEVEDEESFDDDENANPFAQILMTVAEARAGPVSFFSP